MEPKSSGDRGVRIFSITENQCIWMKAGIVNYKLCQNAYDCTSCPFDKAMSRKVVEKPTALVSWQDIKRRKPFFERECRHMLTGRVQFKFCANNYQCKVCEFDQFLDEQDLATATSPVRTDKVSGFALASGYYYHEGHSWARIEHGGFVRLGIDDFALRLLGSPTGISLPKIGTRLKRGENGWSIRREEHYASVLSPMDGTVMATNQSASKQPGLSKKDPYGEGWLIVVDPQGGLRKQTKHLLFEKRAVAWLDAEAKKLEEMVMSVYGVPLAATGGEIVEDIFGNLSHLRWDDLVREFLRT
ncbi:glycine cleavage system protein H [Syntrophobacter fumaroxidans]|uniref:Glycine cleavage H-protein n=1 Tax=Syntrophobacter fumaroxidans (strain DSM 10017 / MPOB) TaxID=335543 RepID=A0LM31_SYNFM|nr:glycine cleavage system protein H [Syntrophobacter fumaroxidans]ABK18483.1 glycine cleavage H-protein [Syntrophobacter fumaroxidans MPOB]